MKTTYVGLIGFGTIGTGVARLLVEQQERISRRCGQEVVLKRIVDTDLKRKRNVRLPKGILSNDYHDVLNDPEISVVVQLIGGTGIERKIMLEMLGAGKNIVTANKALLATFGEEIFEAARKNRCTVAFEAAVGGGIPIIASLAESLAANEIESINAILNGTCNFILSNMEENGSDYAPTLAEAQRLGYAEANPAMDVDGSDTTQKLAILSHIAFGVHLDWHDIPKVGIETVAGIDFRYANVLDYSIKLIASAKRIKSTKKGEADKLELSVSPTLVSKKSQLANVRGPFNAISVMGDAVDHSFYYGRGAGEMPTASAVVADVIDTILGRTKLTFKALNLWNPKTKPADGITIADSASVKGRYYLRVNVADGIGVMAEIAKVLGQNGISIASLIQNEAGEKSDTVPLIILTHETTEGAVAAAIQAIATLPCVCGDVVKMRIFE